MSARINPASILITKEGDMRENSTSNDATRQWRQFAARFFFFSANCDHMREKQRPPDIWNGWNVDGLLELRSMLRAKKKKKKTKEEKRVPTQRRLLLFSSLSPDVYLLSKHVRTKFLGSHFLFWQQLLWRLGGDPPSGHKTSLTLLLFEFFFFPPFSPLIQRSCIYMMDLQYWLNNFYRVWICK